jgi:hypothetical protein
MNYFEKKQTQFLFAIGIFYLIIASLSIILTQKLTIDERATSQIMSYPFQEMMIIITHDVHPPLFYIVSYPFFLLGSIYGVKLFSLCCGICTFFISYDIFKLNRKEFDATILALSLISIPNLIMHFAIARMYSLFLLFEALSLNLTIRLLNARYIKQNVYLHIILMLFVRILSLYTHFFSIVMLFFNLLLIGIHLLFLFKESKKEATKKK